MAPKKKTAESTSTYFVKSPVRHGADRYAIGDTIDLTPSEAEDILAEGHISTEPTEPTEVK